MSVSAIRQRSRRAAAARFALARPRTVVLHVAIDAAQAALEHGKLLRRQAGDGGCFVGLRDRDQAADQRLALGRKLHRDFAIAAGRTRAAYEIKPNEARYQPRQG